MLKLINIKKNYVIDKKPSVVALNNINIEFEQTGFVGILGPSGCGKTTLLNIIGGLDKYSSGDLIIDGISTKEYKSSDWDDYRNKKVGIVFQSYNLIPHLSILNNVELSMTLAGLSKKIRQQKALEALRCVGLDDQAKKKPNQLSGGQMQRVSIARSIVNEPKILLCDEPTGALDSKTSVVVMDLLKELSKDRLIIMVTHNEELADTYCTRLIKLKDGEIIDDYKLENNEMINKSETSSDFISKNVSNDSQDTQEKANNTSNIAKKGCYEDDLSNKTTSTSTDKISQEVNDNFFDLEKNKNEVEEYDLSIPSLKTEDDTLDITRVDNRVFESDKKKKRKKSKMSFGTSLSLSSRNLLTKKGRTFAVAIAGSFGIIGVSLVLALKNGFTNYINRMEKETLTKFPMTVEKYVYSTSFEDYGEDLTDLEKYPDDGSLHIAKPNSTVIKTNKLTPEYIDYVEKMTKEEDIKVGSIQKTYGLNTIVITNNESYDPNSTSSSSKYVLIKTTNSNALSGLFSTSSVWNELPGNEDFVLEQYDLIEGKFPTEANELLITVDSYNRISTKVMQNLGYGSDSSSYASKLTKLSDLIESKEYKMYSQSDYYSNNAKDFSLNQILYGTDTPTEEEQNITEEEKNQRINNFISVNSNIYGKGFKLKRDADYQAFISDIAKLSAISNDPNSEESSDLISTLSGITRYFNTGLENVGELSLDKFKEKNNAQHLMVKYTTPSEKRYDELWSLPDSDLITGKPLKVVGIIRSKKNVSFPLLGSGIYYTSKLTEAAIGKDVINQDGSVTHEDGAYQKEKKDAAENNINVFGETRYVAKSQNDSTKASAKSNEICDDRFYCEKAKYLPSDDMSDNIFLHYSSENLANGIVKGFELDETKPNDAALIEDIHTTIDNFDIIGFLDALVDYAFLNHGLSLRDTFVKPGANKNVVLFIQGLFGSSYTSALDLSNIVKNLENMTPEQKAVYSKVSVAVLKENTFTFTCYNQVGSVKTVDMSTYTDNRQKYGTDLDVQSLTIYPSDYKSKENIIKYLNAWNVGKSEEEKINYTDYASAATDLVGTIVQVISAVLIVFASISLVVSSVMIGIITYVSVIERKKEIGILRSIGARKLDVGTLFIAESSIIGILAGIIGVVVSLIIEIPVNLVLNHIYADVGLGMIANLSPLMALLMIFLSFVLTFISGLIPSVMASKKNPVECLRSE